MSGWETNHSRRAECGEIEFFGRLEGPHRSHDNRLALDGTAGDGSNSSGHINEAQQRVVYT